MTTFDDLKDQTASEKISLATIQGSQRIQGFDLVSGALYSLSGFDHAVTVSLEEDGTELTEVFTQADVVAGTFFNDRSNLKLFVETISSEHPDSIFLVVTNLYFFSTHGVHLPWDLDSGDEVYWLPQIPQGGISEVGVSTNRIDQLAVSLEGSGSIKLNNRSYWAALYDQVTWDFKEVLIYIWSRSILVTEAKLIYRGRIEGRSFDANGAVTFKLKDYLSELKQPLPQVNLEEIPNARIPESIEKVKQRVIYGEVSGFLPLNVDRILDGYPLSGSIDGSGTVISGASSEFLTQLNRGDGISFGSDIEGGKIFGVESVSSDTSLTLSEELENDLAAGSEYFLAESFRPKPYLNRHHTLCQHQIRSPETIIVRALSTILLQLGDATDFNPGDTILIDGTDLAVIASKQSENVIRLTQTLGEQPAGGTAIKRLAIQDVKINKKDLLFSRDYTFNTDNGGTYSVPTISVDPDAEFNIAKVESLTGTVTFNGTRDVTGSGTQFKTELQISDWIRLGSETEFYSILDVVDDTTLTLRTAATYSGTGAAKIKKPEYFDPDSDFLSMRVFGKTDDGLDSGALLDTAPEIVKDLLTVAGLASAVETQSFTDAAFEVPERLGLAIPQDVESELEVKIRDVINQVTRSVLSNIVQTADWKLAFTVLSPKYPDETIRLLDHDILQFQFDSNSKNLFKEIKVKFGFEEYSASSEESLFKEVTKVSNQVERLTTVSNEKTFETILIVEEDAQRFANRRSFIHSVASTVASLRGKLKPIRLQVNSTLDIAHISFYNRIASQSKRKAASIQSLKKTASGTNMSIEDLSNAFSRCARFAESGTPSIDNADEDDLVRFGFFTDENGVIPKASGEKIYGINLYW